MALMKKLPSFFIQILVIALGLSSCSDIFTPKQMPRIENGVIDLRQWDFERMGAVKLDGAWEFYWKQLLTPADFASLIDEPTYIEQPGTWRGTSNKNVPLPNLGYATFRLKILLADTNQSYGLKLGEINTAAKLWINDLFLADIGTVGTNEETTMPLKLPKVFYFPLSSAENTLILQIANYHYINGGIPQEITFGKSEQISQVRDSKLSYDLFLAGSILIIMIYHFGLFFMRRNEISTLYFAIFCLSIAIRTLFSGEQIIAYYFPEIPWEFYSKIGHLGTVWGVSSFIFFIYELYQKDFHRLSLIIASLVGAFYTLITLFTPTIIFAETYIVLYILIVIGGIYILFNLTRALFRHREGAFIALFGFVFVFMTTINDILYINLVIQTAYLAPFGLFVFLISQSFILSSRFAKAYKTVEELSRNLEKKVEERTLELKIERNRLKETNDKILDELNLARDIQSHFIPKESPFPNIGFFYKPMLQVGGDFFDFFQIDDEKIGIFISDVSGHGVPAAFVTSMIKSFISQKAPILYNPSDFLMELNKFLFNLTAGNFVTAFYGIFEPNNQQFHFSNAGHNIPIIIQSEKIEFLNTAKSGIPLAVLTNDELSSIGKDYHNETVHLQKGSKLFLYTDGLIEAVNVHDKQNLTPESIHDFETTELIPAILELKHLPPQKLVNNLMEKLIHFRGSETFDDDVCMICLDI